MLPLCAVKLFWAQLVSAQPMETRLGLPGRDWRLCWTDTARSWGLIYREHTPFFAGCARSITCSWICIFHTTPSEFGSLTARPRTLRASVLTAACCHSSHPAISRFLKSFLPFQCMLENGLSMSWSLDKLVSDYMHRLRMIQPSIYVASPWICFVTPCYAASQTGVLLSGIV